MTDELGRLVRDGKRAFTWTGELLDDWKRSHRLQPAKPDDSVTFREGEKTATLIEHWHYPLTGPAGFKPRLLCRSIDVDLTDGEMALLDEYFRLSEPSS